MCERRHGSRKTAKTMDTMETAEAAETMEAMEAMENTEKNNYERILKDFFEKDDLQALTADAGGLLGCPLLVVDDTFRVISHYLPAGFSDAVFMGAIHRGVVTYEAGAILSQNAELAAGRPAFIMLEDSPYPRRYAALISAGIRLGYLVCVDFSGELKQLPAAAMKTVESVLAKQLYLEASRKDKPLRTAEELLMQLLDGAFPGASFFRLQLGAAGLAGFHPAGFALLNLEGYRSLALGRDRLRDELLRRFPESKPFLYRGDIFLFLHHGDTREKLRAFADAFGMKGVISEEIGELFNLATLYPTAKEGLDLLTGTDLPSGAVYSIEELNLVIQLSRLRQKGSLILPAVRQLAASDRDKGTQYCRTLYTYLVCGHSLQKTSEAAFTHRNTILYRLNRMRAQFNIPLDEAGAHPGLLLSAALVLLETDGPRFFLPRTLQKPELQT